MHPRQSYFSYFWHETTLRRLEFMKTYGYSFDSFVSKYFGSWFMQNLVAPPYGYIYRVQSQNVC